MERRCFKENREERVRKGRGRARTREGVRKKGRRNEGK